MNRMLIAASIGLAFAVQACNRAEEPAAAPQATAPAAQNMPNMPAAGGTPAGQAATYNTTGEIAAIAGNAVTINHQPVPELGWPAMSMTFTAPDPAMITGLATGNKVAFSFREEGAGHVLTEIKPQ
jgi:membrane fusion protein, copper/silver efflux system